jgi:hypothetical protein
MCVLGRHLDIHDSLLARQGACDTCSYSIVTCSSGNLLLGSPWVTQFLYFEGSPCSNSNCLGQPLVTNGSHSSNSVPHRTIATNYSLTAVQHDHCQLCQHHHQPQLCITNFDANISTASTHVHVLPQTNSNHGYKWHMPTGQHLHSAHPAKTALAPPCITSRHSVKLQLA